MSFLPPSFIWRDDKIFLSGVITDQAEAAATVDFIGALRKFLPHYAQPHHKGAKDVTEIEVPNMDPNAATVWARVEIMGHDVVVGQISDVGGLKRVHVIDGKGDVISTQDFGPGAIFRITYVDKATACLLAGTHGDLTVPWQLRQQIETEVINAMAEEGAVLGGLDDAKFHDLAVAMNLEAERRVRVAKQRHEADSVRNDDAEMQSALAAGAVEGLKAPVVLERHPEDDDDWSDDDDRDQAGV